MIGLYYLCFYILLAISILQNLPFFTIIFALVFTLRFGALGLLPLAFLVDAYFGAFSAIPVFSLVAICWYALFELMRPYVRML